MKIIHLNKTCKYTYTYVILFPEYYEIQWKYVMGKSHCFLLKEPLGAFTPSTWPYLVPALSAPALITPGHLGQIAFTPE